MKKEALCGASSEKEKIWFLSQYRQIYLQMERRFEELAYWEQKAQRLSEETQMNKHREEKKNAASKQISLIKKEIEGDIAQLADIRRQIRKAIRSVKDRTLELLLEYRYIDGLPWEELADRLNYTYQWVYVLHKRALTRVALPVLPKKYKSAV